MIEIKADDGMMTVHVRGSEDDLATEAGLLLLTAVKIMKKLDFDRRHCSDEFETALNRYYG